MIGRRHEVPAVLAALVAFAGVVLARRPDAVLRPQFWAEDGMEWYARAHNHGIVQSLLVPYGGYVQAFPRLMGALAQLVPLEHAPLLMVLAALAIQALVPTFLLSARCEPLVAGRARRLLLGLLLVTAPNLFEVHMNVTNVQVHLALLGFLILLARPVASAGWRAFDVGFLLLSGTSGPFCVLLAPVAVVAWWSGRTRWHAVRLACVLAATALQAAVLASFGAGSGRFGVTLGASPGALLDILGGQVFFGGVTGLATYAEAHASGWWGHPWLPRLLGLAGLLWVGRVAWRTRSLALRLVLLLAVLHLAAALSAPILISDRPIWPLLALPAAGMRYYYFAIVAFLATLAWSATADPSRVMRGVAIALLAVTILVGVPRDFRLPPYPPNDFAGEVARFRAARRGTVALAIAPHGWTMELRRWPRALRGRPRASR